MIVMTSLILIILRLDSVCHRMEKGTSHKKQFSSSSTKQKKNKKPSSFKIDYETLGDSYDANQPHVVMSNANNQVPTLLDPTPINLLLVLSALRMERRNYERLRLLPIAVYVNRMVYMARFCPKEDADVLYSDDPTLM